MTFQNCYSLQASDLTQARCGEEPSRVVFLIVIATSWAVGGAISHAARRLAFRRVRGFLEQAVITSFLVKVGLSCSDCGDNRLGIGPSLQLRGKTVRPLGSLSLIIQGYQATKGTAEKKAPSWRGSADRKCLFPFSFSFVNIAFPAITFSANVAKRRGVNSLSCHNCTILGNIGQLMTATMRTAELSVFFFYYG